MGKLPELPVMLGSFASETMSMLLSGYAADVAALFENVTIVEDLNATLLRLVAQLYSLGSSGGHNPMDTSAAASTMSEVAAGALGSSHGTAGAQAEAQAAAAELGATGPASQAGGRL